MELGRSVKNIILLIPYIITILITIMVNIIIYLLLGFSSYMIFIYERIIGKSYVK